MRLHDVVDLAISDAPPPSTTVDTIVRKGRRVRRRRQAGMAGAGVALVVATAFALPALLPGTPGASVTPAAPAAPSTVSSGTAAASLLGDPFIFTFGAFDAGKWHVSAPVVASTAYQIASVYRDGMVTNDRAVDPESIADIQKLKEEGKYPDTLYAFLVLYRPGAYDPESLAGAEKTTVDGHQARIYADPKDRSTRAIAWEYADGAWAVVESRSTSEKTPAAADLRELVAGLDGATATPAKLPFTLSYVPAGYVPVEVGSHATSGLNGIASARDGNYGGAIFTNEAPATTGLAEPFGGVDGADLPGDFEIFVIPAANSNQQKPGTQIRCGNGFCTTRSADGKTSIQVASDGRLSDAEMTKILQGLTLADVTSDANWTDAVTALNP
ncbi:hypothetical protein [Actinoplanes sp. NPDC051851]|uniref:hypothetical protein n=1 Tax=Actinoplanes sp. NPDC051851 TaxID=3154753 RepID=UPI00342D591C